MKAIRLITPHHPLEEQDIPIPTIGAEEVLVRVKAAGICHSDAHYRAGRAPVRPLPLTLGHEVAGVVEKIGANVTTLKIGDRVCLHYNLTCGSCYYCTIRHEQFCPQCVMLGHHINGGYAEYIAVPARNALVLPDALPFEQGATLMCASATALHALRKGRLTAGERVAVFGIGGLGVSAVQLARAFGALEVFAIDLNPKKLALAADYGAIPINAQNVDPVAEVMRLTNQRGVDVALELIGLPRTMRQTIHSVGALGRAVIVGLSDQLLEVDTYREVLGKEAEVIGSNDHLLSELPLLLELARRKVLDTSQVVTRTVPLQAAAINAVLDELENFSDAVRTVIVP